jgi:hypothetical protein
MGMKGETGATGPQGPPGVLALEFYTSTQLSGFVCPIGGTTVASCDPGDAVSGGGWDCSDPGGCTVQSNSPSGDDAWQIVGCAEVGAELVAVARCADLTP